MPNTTKAHKIESLLAQSQKLSAREISKIVGTDVSYVYEIASRVGHSFSEPVVFDKSWERDMVRGVRDIVADAVIEYALGQITRDDLEDVIDEATEVYEDHTELAKREGLELVLLEAKEAS